MSDFEPCVSCNSLGSAQDGTDLPPIITITIPQVEGVTPQDVKTFLEMVHIASYII